MSNGMISATELQGRLGAAQLRVVDASFHLPGSGRDANLEFLQAHIPGAQRFDIEAIADHTNSLPHMLPTPSEFSASLSRLSIAPDHDVVVYDTSGLLGAARAWWMLRVFGHDRVKVLDGGLAAWQRLGGALESGAAAPGHIPPSAVQIRPELVRDRAAIEAIVRDGGSQIIDARGATRFRGESAEPRPGLRSGHIPRSVNIPSANLLNADGTLQSAASLREIFAQAEVRVAEPIVASCGSGVSACVVALALYTLGYETTAVYDGSWSEWGADSHLPIAVGPA